MTEPQPRVRVTAQSALEHARQPSQPAIDAKTIYLRTLIRSQLRLALYCLAGFVGLLALFLVMLTYFGELTNVRVLGVPLSWILLGFGVYPLIVTTALIYARSARRNEANYRQLLQTERADE